MSNKPLLITMGDPAGIGPEIVTLSLAQLHGQEDLHAVVVGDVGVMRHAAARLAQQGLAKVKVLELSSLDALESMAPNQAHEGVVMPVLQVMPALPPISLGQVSATAGQASATAVEWAAQAVLQGRARGLATAPIHKQAWHAAGLTFPGHTEMLQALSAQHLGCSLDALPVRMMLATPRLRVVLVTIHLALREAIAALSPELVLQTLRIAHKDLAAQLQRPPRLVVAGLNPHAGEGGQMGDEEIRILGPAIQMAQQEGLQVSGPLPSDTVFLQALDSDRHPERFDAVVVMYHDQGLIPIKLLGFDEGVNVTLGLPLRRTSPDHGTAFDLAGSGRARPDSMMAAIRLLGLF